MKTLELRIDDGLGGEDGELSGGAAGEDRPGADMLGDDRLAEAVSMTGPKAVDAFQLSDGMDHVTFVSEQYGAMEHMGG